MTPITLEINKIRAVVFDLDNTLVSCELNFSQLRAELGCPQGIDLLSFVDAIENQGVRQRATQTILDHELSDAQHATPLSGCHDLLHYLKKEGIRTAIVTRNCLEASELKLRHTGIEVEALLTREHGAPKPNPQSLITLMKQWQLLPEQILYVGDYLYDLQAAFNASMPSCLVTNGVEKGFSSQASLCVARLDELLQTLQQHRV
ncbi:HAD-IA family hydrolase [Vibrio vulnificus]|nr:HAD-IA family hydrolase [Vibrio vulnificus]ELP5730981.1 HAD-IA family hydrolase [Vibrio vulnificus]